MARNVFIKLGLSLIFFGFILMIRNDISLYITDFIHDAENGEMIVKEIDNNYEQFNKLVKDYREELVTFSNYFDVFYFDNFSNTNSKLVAKMDDITKKVKDINYYVDLLSKDCKYELSNQTSIKKCSNFYVNYESVANSYLECVENYNVLILKYNNYAASNGLESIDLYNLDDAIIFDI